MIPEKRAFFLFVCLTLWVLAACEPLAPDQTPRVIVVTGETPATIAWAPTQPIGSTTGTPTGLSNASGAVSTLTPTPTPSPLPSPTTEMPACDETTGQIIQSSFLSSLSGGEEIFDLYLPPCFYTTFQRYPYVILLHGTGYDGTMWEQLGIAAVMDNGIISGTLPPMVLVLPNGGSLSELNDQPDGASYETVILDELIPAVETGFCVWSSHQGRAIGGISRGGFWAFSIALRHPDLFSALGGHSPYFESDNAGPDTNPLDLVNQVSADKFLMRVYIDHAAADIVAANAQQMSDLLTAKGIDHTYIVNETGDHDMDYWQAHLPEYLSFYGQAWPNNSGALPSCLEPNPAD